MPKMVEGRLVAYTEEEYHRDQRYQEYENLIEGRWADFDWFSRLVDAIRSKQVVLTSRNSELIWQAGFKPPSVPMDTVVIFGVNLPRNIATMMADFMVNTPPTVKIRRGGADEKAMEEADKKLSERYLTEQFWTLFWEAMVDLSGYGTGYLKLIPEQFGDVGSAPVDGKGSAILGQSVRLSIQSPRHVFVTNDPMNRKRATQIEIRFPFEYGGKEYLYVETHTRETISITAYEFEGRQPIEDPHLYMEANQRLKPEAVPGVVLAAFNIQPGTKPNPLAPYADQLAEPFLIQPIHNFRSGAKYHGFSDFQGHEGALDEIMHRMSMLSRGMDLTDDPKANAPESSFQRLPDGSVVFNLSGARVFPYSDGGKGVEPIVWDQKIVEKWAAIEKLILRVLAHSEVSLDLIAPDLTRGTADSGVAMQFRLIPTVNKRNRVRRYLNMAASDLLKKMIILDRPFKRIGEEPAPTPSPASIPPGFDIQWNESAVKDRAEEVTYWRRRVDSGFSTRVEAMMALDGITEEEATERLERIIEEQTKFLPEPLKTGWTDPDLNDPNEGDGGKDGT